MNADEAEQMLHNRLQTWHSQSSKKQFVLIKMQPLLHVDAAEDSKWLCSRSHGFTSSGKGDKNIKGTGFMLEKVAPKSSALGQTRWSWGRLAVGGAPQMLVIAALFLRVRLPPSGRQIPLVRLGSLS